MTQRLVGGLQTAAGILLGLGLVLIAGYTVELQAGNLLFAAGLLLFLSLLVEFAAAGRSESG